MVSSVQMEPVSRTDQYKRVMKPLLERKRRARINRCLDELRDLLVAALQAEGETVTRLEKADILELTVRHVRRLNQRRRLLPSLGNQQDPRQDAFKFQQGFLAAAQQVQSFLMSTSALEPTASSRLIMHLSSCASALANSGHPSPPPGFHPQDPSQSLQKSPPIPGPIHDPSNPTLNRSTVNPIQPSQMPPPTAIIPPKCSPPMSPPPLIDLSVKSAIPAPHLRHPQAHIVVAPTPVKSESPVIFKDPALPEDLSMRKDNSRDQPQEYEDSREDPKESKDAWRPW